MEQVAFMALPIRDARAAADVRHSRCRIYQLASVFFYALDCAIHILDRDV